MAWERASARWTRTIVCVSSDEQRLGESVGIRGCFAVMPNGVDLSRWPVASAEDRAEARRHLGLDEGPLAVCVGRLSEQKGQDVLLKAWGQVANSVPSAELALVGEGPARAELESGAPARVRFAGKRDDVDAWVAAADVVVVPSRWEAGLSLVLMEAMARGRSVVATEVAGTREGLEGGCGRVVATEAVQPLAEALVERLSDPSLAAREGVAGRRRIEERHDLARTSARMADLYESVIGRG